MNKILKAFIVTLVLGVPDLQAQIPLPTPCFPDEETLCLLNSRVQVKARWKNQHADGTEGRAHAQVMNDKTGLFWFFAEDTTEIIVKAIDGTSFNHSLWFFLGSLSDVEFWVDVIDTATGQARTYYNPPGNVFGIADTEAFNADGVNDFCGGIGGLPCQGPLVCDNDPGQCQTADVGGSCVESPEVCPEIFDPVCGCNGVTYSNDCQRLLVGMAKDHDGECTFKEFCGGIAGFPCPDGQVCDYEPGMCQVSDLAGFCVPDAEVCLAIFDPVCGCNGMTYGNDCERLRARIPKDHDGECKDN